MVGESFDWCLNNLAEVPKRCEECNLVQNSEKCHFMVKEGIVLGHQISKKGIEVDQTKVEVIGKIPPSISIGCEIFSSACSFLSDIYQGYFKNSNPLCELLEMDNKFYFDESWLKEFVKLKEKLVSEPIINSPIWGE